MGENALSYMMQFGIFSPSSLKMLGFMFHSSKLMYFDTIFLIIATMSGYCVYNRWYSHFCKFNHCWFDLCKFYFTGCFFSGSGCDNCNLGKSCVILRPTLCRWFYPFSSKTIWMFTLVGWWFPPSMCQHSMVGKGLWRSSFFYFTSFYK
jgi:hypothetical protein